MSDDLQRQHDNLIEERLHAERKTGAGSSELAAPDGSKVKTIAEAQAEYRATRGTHAVRLLHRVLDKIIGLKCPHCGEPVNITIESN